jgi:hypothetical protein
VNSATSNWERPFVVVVGFEWAAWGCRAAYKAVISSYYVDRIELFETAPSS